ncbi:hypothetical protein [Bradyrhizobium ottawaense]|uniref:hypothetical protein n=1 Tax=Bradyrhizobium ottawaense TaxID=931866 RepID=UPI003835BBF5
MYIELEMCPTLVYSRNVVGFNIAIAVDNDRPTLSRSDKVRAGVRSDYFVDNILKEANICAWIVLPPLVKKLHQKAREFVE